MNVRYQSWSCNTVSLPLQAPDRIAQINTYVVPRFPLVESILYWAAQTNMLKFSLVPLEGQKLYIGALNIYKILTKWNVSVFFLIRRWRGLLSFRLWWPGRSWRSVWCRSSPPGHCKWPSVPWLIRWCAFLSLPVPLPPLIPHFSVPGRGWGRIGAPRLWGSRVGRYQRNPGRLEQEETGGGRTSRTLWGNVKTQPRKCHPGMGGRIKRWI